MIAYESFDGTLDTWTKALLVPPSIILIFQLYRPLYRESITSSRASKRIRLISNVCVKLEIGEGGGEEGGLEGVGDD